MSSCQDFSDIISQNQRNVTDNVTENVTNLSVRLYGLRTIHTPPQRGIAVQRCTKCCAKRLLTAGQNRRTRRFIMIFLLKYASRILSISNRCDRIAKIPCKEPIIPVINNIICNIAVIETHVSFLSPDQSADSGINPAQFIPELSVRERQQSKRHNRYADRFKSVHQQPR